MNSALLPTSSVARYVSINTSMVRTGSRPAAGFSGEPELREHAGIDDELRRIEPRGELAGEEGALDGEVDVDVHLEIDESGAVCVVLEPGQISLHNGTLIVRTAHDRMHHRHSRERGNDSLHGV